MIRADNSRRNPDSCRTRRNILQHHGIGAYLGVPADRERSDDPGTGVNVDVARDSRCAPVARADCYLLEHEAIRAQLCLGMDDDSVRMKNKQPATEAAFQWYLGSCYNAPPAVA